MSWISKLSWAGTAGSCGPARKEALFVNRYVHGKRHSIRDCGGERFASKQIEAERSVAFVKTREGVGNGILGPL